MPNKAINPTGQQRRCACCSAGGSSRALGGRTTKGELTCVSGPCIRNTSTLAGSLPCGGKASWRRRCSGVARTATGITRNSNDSALSLRLSARSRTIFVAFMRRPSIAATRSQRRKISPARGSGVIAVTRGQLMHEWSHLMAKLAIRDPELRGRLTHVRRPQSHPSFRIVSGDVETWERRGDRCPTTGCSGRRCAPPLNRGVRRHHRHVRMRRA